MREFEEWYEKKADSECNASFMRDEAIDAKDSAQWAWDYQEGEILVSFRVHPDFIKNKACVHPHNMELNEIIFDAIEKATSKFNDMDYVMKPTKVTVENNV